MKAQERKSRRPLTLNVLEGTLRELMDHLDFLEA